MELDTLSVVIMTSLVVVVAGVVYLIGTLYHAESRAARLWSLGFFAGILTTVCYIVWAATPGAWVAIAIGNASFIVSPGAMWLGCRGYNGRPIRWQALGVAAGSAATLIAALAEGPQGGDWAGALVTFSGVAVFAALATAETRRGVLATQMPTATLTAVFAIQALYFAVRTVVFATAGPESELFRGWFDTIPTSFLVIALTVVTVVVAAVLRAAEPALRAGGAPATLTVSPDGLFSELSFARVLGDVTYRAAASGEQLAVIALRIDDLPRIVSGFGSTDAAAIERAWRNGARKAAPLASVVGEAGQTGIVIVAQAASETDARRVAGRIHGRVVEELATSGSVVTPVVGVGVALSDVTGYDPGELIAAANDAAVRSESSPDSSVVIATAP